VASGAANSPGHRDIQQHMHCSFSLLAQRNPRTTHPARTCLIPAEVRAWSLYAAPANSPLGIVGIGQRKPPQHEDISMIALIITLQFLSKCSNPSRTTITAAGTEGASRGSAMDGSGVFRHGARLAVLWPVACCKPPQVSRIYSNTYYYLHYYSS
jgi:hypothetical protein